MIPVFLWQPEGARRDLISNLVNQFPQSFCPLCFSPISKSDLLRLSGCQDYDILDAACCSSCRFQIFPKDPSSMEHFLSVLPQTLLARAKNCSNGNHSSQYLLLQVASENGYNRLVLGLFTSRIACHVITATVKDRQLDLVKYGADWRYTSEFIERFEKRIPPADFRSLQHQVSY
ncbi:hypothetical protein Q3G72_003993 [Acer saccharum]|nr:hypothetical protein Q3G72_003993 [Acer saccharum]